MVTKEIKYGKLSVGFSILYFKTSAFNKSKFVVRGWLIVILPREFVSIGRIGDILFGGLHLLWEHIPKIFKVLL